MWALIMSLPRSLKIGTLATFAATVIGLLLAGVWYGNSQWAKGEQSGRENAASWLLKEKQADWDAREQQIETSIAMMEDQMRTLNRVTAEVVTARVTLRDQYAMLAATVTAERSADEKIVASVPDSELRAAIRAISRELAGSGQ